MSSSSFRSVCVNDVISFGLKEAFILNHIRFWVKQNEVKKSKKHFSDNKYWVYFTSHDIQEYLPFLSTDQIQRSLKSLLAKNAILISRIGNTTRRYYTLFESRCQELIENEQKETVNDTVELQRFVSANDVSFDINEEESAEKIAVNENSYNIDNVATNLKSLSISTVVNSMEKVKSKASFITHKFSTNMQKMHKGTLNDSAELRPLPAELRLDSAKLRPDSAELRLHIYNRINTDETQMKPELKEINKESLKTKNTAVKKPPVEKPKFDFSGFSQEEQIKIEEFLEYRKKDMNKPLKTQRGLTSLRDTLLELKNRFENICACIDQSMSHEWLSVFAIKKQFGNSSTKTQKYDPLRNPQDFKKMWDKHDADVAAGNPDAYDFFGEA